MFSPFKIYSDCWDCVLDVSIYFQIKNSSKHSSFFLSFSKSDIFIHLSNKTNLEFTWSISTVLFILVFLQIYFSSSIALMFDWAWALLTFFISQKLIILYWFIMVLCTLNRVNVPHSKLIHSIILSSSMAFSILMSLMCLASSLTSSLQSL